MLHRPRLRSEIAVTPLWMALLLLAALATIPAAGQIPDEFKNLEVLPKNTSKDELVAVMRNFSFALGVRCWYCHKGEEGMPFSEFDFASDEKAPKRAARVMMRMTRDINTHQLPLLQRVEGRPAHNLEVTCATCHRGVALPRSLEDLLAEVIAKDGVAAATARYRELKEQYYGRASYDFGEQTLRILAESLQEAGNLDAAVAMAELNAELFPESAMAHYILGEGYRLVGRLERARASYERSLELNPRNPRVKQRLEELSRPEGSAPEAQ